MSWRGRSWQADRLVRGKPEIRRPKAERRPKSECRSSAPVFVKPGGLARLAQRRRGRPQSFPALLFEPGVQISDFGFRPSAFGFPRPSRKLQPLKRFTPRAVFSGMG